MEVEEWWVICLDISLGLFVFKMSVFFVFRSYKFGGRVVVDDSKRVFEKV